jgi:hypothetical protein
MIAVITGDIINSRGVNSDIWLPKLKRYMENAFGDNSKWEIYRGDSFQVETTVVEALEVALCIKALVKTNAQIDVRMSIGVGDKSYNGSRVTESNGTAFIYSGDGIELMKNNTLFIKTPWTDINDYFETILKLISFISDDWKPATSESIYYSLVNKGLRQKELAVLMGKRSSTVSLALKRGGYNEIMGAVELYRKKIEQCTSCYCG